MQKCFYPVYPCIKKYMVCPPTPVAALFDLHPLIPLMRLMHKLGQEGTAIIWCLPH